MYITSLQLLIVTCICIINSASTKEISTECDVLEQHLHIKSCTTTVITCVISDIQANPGDTLTLTNAHELNFTSFELHNSQIEILPKEILKQLPMIQHLDLNGNDLKILPNRVFEKASADLAEIELQYNLIQEISAETFYGLRNLLILDLSTNIIEGIAPKAFVPLKKLEYLDLSTNQIKFVEEETFAPLKSLKTLLLNHNDITRIDSKTFGTVPDLITLDFDGNFVKDHLELELASSSLNALHFARNQLSSLTIKKSSGNVKTTEIRTLYLQNNEFMNLSDIKMDKGVIVSSLHLDSNEISSLSNLSPFYATLTRLSLYSNPITEIDFESDMKMSTLKHLNLGDLSHVILRSKIFEPLQGLQTLSLAENYLRGLDHEWFVGLTNLTELDLELNFLSNFDYKALVKVLPSLKTLKLSNNDLNCTFLEEMVSYLKNFTKVTIPKDFSDSYARMYPSTFETNMKSYEGIVCDTKVVQASQTEKKSYVGLKILYWTIVVVVGLVGTVVGLAFASKKLKWPIVWPKWRRGPVRRSLEVVVTGNTGVVQEHQ